MTKHEARTLSLQKRLALGEKDFQKLNEQLAAKFFSGIDLTEIRTLHTYLPIRNKKEPDTWLIVKSVRNEFPKMRLAVPVMNANGTLDHYYLENASRLTTNAWGIEEPVNATPATIADFDIVIAPLLAIDRLGNRVGYGKGFYDQFLKEVRKDCRTIGLSFFEPLAEPIATEEHDVRLMSCVTPSGLYDF